MSQCLIAEYETNEAAKVGLETLEKHRFTLVNVSVVANASDPAVAHLHGIHDDSSPHVHSASAPAGRNTSLGMLIGGSIAAPIAAGTLVGPLVIAGPLVGMAVGAMIGGLLGSMEHWGVDRDVSADYERRVTTGSVLLIVHDVSNQRLGEARLLLDATDPKTIESYEAD